MNLNEHTLEVKDIYRGRIFRVQQALVRLPNGHKAQRDVVRHGGAVAVLAEPKPGQVVLVRQYRYATGEQLWEIPAGKLEDNESPTECAVRELEEETGFYPRHLQQIYSFYTSPGFTSELLHLFYANDLILGRSCTDADEFLAITTLPLADALTWLKRGNIKDAKTIIALQWAACQQLA
ncbi:MAG TPA: NUDIX hydrolase [bacterium]|nr:NUDIX hydrolase [bacterium]